MARFTLVPIPLAVPLMVLIFALIPLTPIVWVWVVLTQIARGIRQQQAPVEVLRAIGQRIGLTLALPWIALLALSAMVIFQLFTTPFVLLHHLRTLPETITWACTNLGLTPEPSSQHPPHADLHTTPISPLPPYEYIPLPPNSIRLLTIHPAPLDAPLRGTLTTHPFHPNSPIMRFLRPTPPYDAISYTWDTHYSSASLRHPSAFDSPYTSADEDTPTLPRVANTTALGCAGMDILLLLDPAAQTWSELWVGENCAAALRRVRSGTEERRVWIDQVCIKGRYDPDEKTRLVEVMDRVYGGATRVVVYTGEADGWPPEADWTTDRMFDWVNSLSRTELRVPGEVGEEVLFGMQPDLGARLWQWGRKAMVAGLGVRGRKVFDDIGRLWLTWGEKGKAAWRLVEEEYRVGMLGLPPTVSPAPPGDLQWVLKAYFDRCWFRSLWPVQEVVLPGLSKVRFICGSKTTAAERMLHLSTLLDECTHSRGLNMERVFRLFQQPLPKRSPRRSRLLDVMIATANRSCADKRDKIYAVLNIARRLDDGLAALGPGSVDYRKEVSEVFTFYSAQFIRWHGPGFFLALIKPKSGLTNLPSWVADFDVHWPNRRALGRLEVTRPPKVANEKDCVRDFVTDSDGKMVMKIMRPRIVRGFFTRDGHLEGNRNTHIENVRQLPADEILVEMYPGLALLLRRGRGELGRYMFVLACPHALSREGLERVVAGWSKVVVDQQDIGRQDIQGSPARGYLSLPGVYQIV